MTFSVHGFDKSSYQSPGGFADGGRRFAFFKATEGTGYFDKNFNANRQAAKDESMIVAGAYHFARPDKTPSPQAEAKWFLDHVGKPAANEVAILDYENPPGGTLVWNEDWVVAWARAVQAAGWRVVFYTYLGKLTSNPTVKIAAAIPDLWIAAYGSKPPKGDRWTVGPYGWTWWQHTDGQSSVPGNDGPCDCSVFYGSEDELRAWIGGDMPLTDAEWTKLEGLVQKVVSENFHWWAGKVDGGGGNLLLEIRDDVKKIQPGAGPAEYVGTVDLKPKS